jgi:cell division protein FtsZ
MNLYEESSKQTAKIRVVGVGGAGCNAVNTMISASLDRVDFITANTDIQALAANLAPTKLQIGSAQTRGLGAGANPEVGRAAALESKEEISKALEGADMVFVTAGMGGGTGTGAAPIIADIARNLGCLTVGVVTKPFQFEGSRRRKQAEAGIVEMRAAVDTLITIPNHRLLTLSDQPMPLLETFKRADEVLLNAVRGISDLVQYHGVINVDFADVSTIMRDKGVALMGTGRAKGEKRALAAVKQAISSPLLEDVTLDGATGLLINITGGRDLTIQEVHEAMMLVHDAADPDAEIIFGSVVDDTYQDEIKVTLIATGFVQRDSRRGGRTTVSQPALSPPPRTLSLGGSSPSHRDEPATLVSPSRPLTRTTSGEIRPLTGRHPAFVDEPSEEDLEKPAFLRRGHPGSDYP